MSDVRLGRIPSPDDSRDFLMAAVLPPAVAVGSRFWTPGPVLNQGSTPECVGYGSEGLLNASPVRQTYLSGDGIYQACKKIDGSPKSGGTYPRAALKVLTDAGRIASFHRAETIDDVLAWLRMMGPVLAGTNWLQDMFRPPKTGIVSVTGAVAGGHCYLVDGVSAAKIKGQLALRCRNSWGSAWGLSGNFYIRATDFAGLMQNGGEAWSVIEAKAA